MNNRMDAIGMKTPQPTTAHHRTPPHTTAHHPWTLASPSPSPRFTPTHGAPKPDPAQNLLRTHHTQPIPVLHLAKYYVRWRQVDQPDEQSVKHLAPTVDIQGTLAA